MKRVVWPNGQGQAGTLGIKELSMSLEVIATKS